jgi:hypothetical protein
MKHSIELLGSCSDPRFADVARIIANDVPPAWLAAGLEQFSGFVSTTPEDWRRWKNLFEKLTYSTDLLIKWLPLFEHLPIGDCPDDVAIALDVLPRIKKALALRPTPRAGGPRPNIQRQFSAAVVVEGWRLVRKKFQPRSTELYTACAEYWRVCSGEDRPLEKWREDVEHATRQDYRGVRDILAALKLAAN